NGGPTKTHALLPMTCFDDMCLPYTPSEAIDAADSGACPSTDQRGVARPQGGACDIGAFELTKRGDIDCNGGVNSVDALNLLRFVAGLSVSQQPGCTPIGASLPLPIPTWPPAHFGDVDCDGAVNAVDALKVLRYVAGLSVSQELGCTELGTTSGTG
ncbi:MAG TPA: choice-of-anchor Q domain-containing protein, partial [Anaerolineae bacterium]|nr:choice-of-anchor Q domain-containing protein [Anaerolineae bacterium]